jgi:succinate dehydrogenase/fumarate reductase-like Fe-S protein
MTSLIPITINGSIYQVEVGISVAAAIAHCGSLVTRTSVTGTARAPVCGMGICQECRVSINGQAHQLACQTLCLPDMKILTGDQA